MSLKLAPGKSTMLIVALAMFVLGAPAEATLSNPPIQQKVDAPSKLVDGNALRVPMSTRAVTVRPELSSTATGYVIAGARVDVLLLARHDGKASAKTILRSLLVLAVNRTEGAGSARVLVTLAVPTARVERLVRAEVQGEIRLAACPIATSPPNAREMHSVKVPIKTKVARTDRATPDNSPDTVTVIRGAQVDLVPLNAAYTPPAKDPAATTPPTTSAAAAPDPAAAPAKPGDKKGAKSKPATKSQMPGGKTSNTKDSVGDAGAPSKKANHATHSNQE